MVDGGVRRAKWKDERASKRDGETEGANNRLATANTATEEVTVDDDSRGWTETAAEGGRSHGNKKMTGMTKEDKSKEKDNSKSLNNNWR